MTISGWQVTIGMPLKPHCCAACGSSGEMTEKGPPPAYFATGVDINWGDSLYLCDTCVRIVGELRGMIDVGTAHKLERELEASSDTIRQLHEENAELQERLDKIVGGSRAIKEHKARSKPAPKRKAAA